MALLTKELAHSALKDNLAYLIGPAPLVSALDMKGFSLTLLKLNDLFEKALHEEVETLGWQKPVAFAPLRTQEHSAIHDRVEFTPSANPQVGEYVSVVTKTLIQLENHLNALDAKVGMVIPDLPLRKGRGRLRSVWRRTTFLLTTCRHYFCWWASVWQR